MADPIKPLDRLKPFKRINNASAIPGDAPSGLGVACGCHTPDEFPNLEADFRKFLNGRPGALGAFAKMIEAAKDAAKVADQVVSIAKDVAALAGLAAAALSAAFGPGAPIVAPLTAVLAAVGSAIKAVQAITEFVNRLLSVIDTAIREFLARIGSTLAKRALRRIPQWVPVEDAANKDKITAAQVREVEGVVRRSYCDPMGTPFFQWQQWLSWSIQVQPEPAYQNLLVPGFKFATDDDIKAAGAIIVDPATLDLQWDMGALRVGGNEPGVYARKFDTDKTEAALIGREAPFFQSDKSGLEPENNWLWPTAGMYVWASGRWVYDCSRPDSLTDKNPKMFTMLNPLRAMATSSWEAFGFQENAPGPRAARNAVPAIRFMFIASRHGGHLTHPLLAEKDYEFILDLPPMPVPVSPFPVGHTNAHKRGDDELPDFPHNTIVLRPKLLRDLARPQMPPEALGPTVKLVNPIIELLPSADSPGTVKQVKLTVRAGDLDFTGHDHAGFLLSLGWFDPNKTRAETVKSVTVEFSAVRGRLQKERDDAVNLLRGLFKKELDEAKKSVEDQIDKIKIPLIPGNPTSIDDMVNNNFSPPLKGLVAKVGVAIRDLAHKIVDTVFDKLLDLIGDAVNGLSSEEWMVHFGVNGRWRTRFLDLDKNKQQAFSSPAVVEMLLGPDDQLFHSSSGVQWNGVGDVMQAVKNDRMLKLNNEAVDWSKIATAKGDELRDLMFEYALAILVGPKLALILGVENDPLGIRQPAFPSDPKGLNPMPTVGADPGSAPFDGSSPPFARAAGQEEVLSVEDSAIQDYVLTGKVDVGQQFPL